jgi:hypothetical protein
LPGYSTRNLLLHVGGQPWQLRVLGDRQQFSDPDGHGERLGVAAVQRRLYDGSASGHRRREALAA